MLSMVLCPEMGELSSMSCLVPTSPAELENFTFLFFLRANSHWFPVLLRAHTQATSGLGDGLVTWCWISVAQPCSGEGRGVSETMLAMSCCRALVCVTQARAALVQRILVQAAAPQTPRCLSESTAKPTAQGLT